MSTTKDPSLQTLRRKLERWELHHLRDYVTELHGRLDAAETEAKSAWDAADHWRDNCMRLTEALMADGVTIGLTQAGQLGAVDPDSLVVTP